MIRIPPPRGLRFGRFFIGAALLLWLSLEDNAVLTPTLLGAAAVAFVIVERAWRVWSARELSPASLLIRATLNGLWFGVMSAAASAALMFFKNAWHAHAVWDYPPGLVVEMLFRIPVWGIAGLLVGGGIATLILASQKRG